MYMHWNEYGSTEHTSSSLAYYAEMEYSLKDVKTITGGFSFSFDKVISSNVFMISNDNCKKGKIVFNPALADGNKVALPTMDQSITVNGSELILSYSMFIGMIDMYAGSLFYVDNGKYYMKMGTYPHEITYVDDSCPPASTTGTNLLWLWILLGVIAVVIIVAVIIVVVIRVGKSKPRSNNNSRI
ncbi:hypothetical protein WA158_000047 [Blastocystis sp. Blastoise]